VVGSLLLSEPVLAIIRRELKKLSDGARIEVDEVEEIVRTEVLKREVVEGEQAEAAQARVNKFYRKSVIRRRQNRSETIAEPPTPDGRESLTERLLREAGEQGVGGEMS
jgi:hypothetical protein